MLTMQRQQSKDSEKSKITGSDSLSDLSNPDSTASVASTHPAVVGTRCSNYSVKFDGEAALHEFATIGAVEDVTDLILNLKTVQRER